MAESKQRWDPGDYNILVDLYPRPIRGSDGKPYDFDHFHMGDLIRIDDPAEAQGLGGAGAIAPVDSLEARQAILRSKGNPEDGVALLRAEQLEEEARQLRLRHGQGEAGG